MATLTASPRLETNAVEDVIRYDLKTIVVAYDKSAASERALADAIFLGKQFHAEILLARVLPPSIDAGGDFGSLREAKKLERAELNEDAERIVNVGIRSHALLREGVVGDSLFNICCEELADLVLLGAYGFGLQDRPTLGSTAEHLLRVMPCPAITYGPNIAFTLASGTCLGPILLPVELGYTEADLGKAASIARLLNRPVRLLHVLNTMAGEHLSQVEEHCKQLAAALRRHGIPAQWSLLCGSPAATIVASAIEGGSPLIIMPLKSKRQHQGAAADDIAANVIRAAGVPVLTYRCA